MFDKLVDDKDLESKLLLVSMRIDSLKEKEAIFVGICKDLEVEAKLRAEAGLVSHHRNGFRVKGDVEVEENTVEIILERIREEIREAQEELTVMKGYQLWEPSTENVQPVIELKVEA